MSAALESRRPKRLGLLLAQCAEPVASRQPAFERLRDKIGAKLACVVVFALAGNDRGFAGKHGSLPVVLRGFAGAGESFRRPRAGYVRDASLP